MKVTIGGGVFYTVKAEGRLGSSVRSFHKIMLNKTFECNRTNINVEIIKEISIFKLHSFQIFLAKKKPFF